MTNSSTAATLFETPQRHSVSSLAFQTIVIFLVLTEAALAASVQHGWLSLAVPLVLVASHFMHGQLIGFHEASHGLLRKSRRLNEFDGVLIGVLSFTSFSLYRAAHQLHHAQLATERDEELWPFVNPAAPRWGRCLAAFLELTAGLFFTPFLFVRTFLRRGSPIRNEKLRRRIWMEFALTVAVWVGILSAVAHWDAWRYFTWLYLVPAFIAANLQSWRKYIEHVGLTGGTVNSATRNIVSSSWLGRLVAFTLLHEPFHGVHHQRPGLPHGALPQYVSIIEPVQAEELPLYPSYWRALRHLLRSLTDPRVGAQWRAGA